MPTWQRRCVQPAETRSKSADQMRVSSAARMLPRVHRARASAHSHPISWRPVPRARPTGDDIVDEVLGYFKANVLFKQFQPAGDADRVLVYLTLYTTQASRDNECPLYSLYSGGYIV